MQLAFGMVGGKLRRGESKTSIPVNLLVHIIHGSLENQMEMFMKTALCPGHKERLGMMRIAVDKFMDFVNLMDILI